MIHTSNDNKRFCLKSEVMHDLHHKQTSDQTVYSIGLVKLYLLMYLPACLVSTQTKRSDPSVPSSVA